jgi:nucleoside-diphosphate-sugar epimerase
MQGTSRKPIVLITGSSGLIGSAVAAALAGDYDTVGIDAKFPSKDAVIGDFIECDLTSEDSVDVALETVAQRHGTEIASVVHLAAYYDFSGEPSDMYDKLTVQGTARLLKNLQEFQTNQFVFASSILVLEPAEETDEMLTETSPLEDEPWDYPKSKIDAEEAIRREQGDIPAVILRIAGVYDDNCHSIPISQQISRIYEEKLESHFFPGDASHGQAFIHLDDLVGCVLRVVARREDLKNELFLIAEPDVMSYDELQEQLGKLIHGEEWTTIWLPKFLAKAGAWAQENVLGKKTFIKPWMVDLADQHYPIAIGHAQEKLGWKPQKLLRDTLPEIIGRLKAAPARWYDENNLELPDELRKKAASG